MLSPTIENELGSKFAANVKFGGANGQTPFEDPFLMDSAQYMPRSMDNVWDYCFFLFHMNGSFRQAVRRVVSYFLTDVEFTGENTGDDKEQRKFKEILVDQLNIFGVLFKAGMEYGCFAAGTSVVTRNGVFKIEDLVGKRVDVLSKDGVYRPADFKSFGTQELLEVTFSDGRTVLATPNHEWEVKNCSNKSVRIFTTQLKQGHRIKRTVAPRPERNEEYMEGVRHGFIFGDGTRVGVTRSRALFTGHKDSALFPYFEGRGNPRRQCGRDSDVKTQSGFPRHYKELPEATKSASYWYGFVSGFLAADGSVDTYGCALLTQKSADVLEAIAAQLPRIGMVAGPVRSHDAWVTPPKQTKPRLLRMSYVTLLKQFMQEEDFIIPAHRENFVKNRNPDSNYGQFIGVESVNPTGRFEEVYCCVEMETHTFVIDNGILTGNCYGNSFLRRYFPFERVLIDRRNGHTREYALSMLEQLGPVKYNYKELVYEVADPTDNPKSGGTRKRIKLPFRDKPSKDVTKMCVDNLDVRDIILVPSLMGQQTRIIYRFSQDFLFKVHNGDPFHVNSVPIEFLEAIAKNEDFLFHPGQVFHLKAPTINGLRNNAWGIPETLANYRTIHHLQVLRRIDEAVGLDYLLPFRVFTPEPSAASSGALYDSLFGTFKSEMTELIARRRANPTAIHAAPFPIALQELGGTGKNLVTADLVKMHTAQLMDEFNIPAEMYTGQMQLQNIPTAIRLFEKSWGFLYWNFNQLLKWVADGVQDVRREHRFSLQLEKSVMADDLEERQAYMQLVASGEISRARAYRTFNIEDPIEEKRRRLREDLEIEKDKAKLQQDFEQDMQTGNLGQQPPQAGGGASPSPGAGGYGNPPQGANVTPLDVVAEADQIAQQLLQIPDNGTRSKELQKLKATRPDLHAMVKQKMEEYRAQGASQGRKQVGQGG